MAVPVQKHFIPAVVLAKGADLGVGGPEQFFWRVCHIRTVALIDEIFGGFSASLNGELASLWWFVRW